MSVTGTQGAQKRESSFPFDQGDSSVVLSKGEPRVESDMCDVEDSLVSLAERSLTMAEGGQSQKVTLTDQDKVVFLTNTHPDEITDSPDERKALCEMLAQSYEKRKADVDGFRDEFKGHIRSDVEISLKNIEAEQAEMRLMIDAKFKSAHEDKFSKPSLHELKVMLTNFQLYVDQARNTILCAIAEPYYQKFKEAKDYKEIPGELIIKKALVARLRLELCTKLSWLGWYEIPQDLQQALDSCELAEYMSSALLFAKNNCIEATAQIQSELVGLFKGAKRAEDLPDDFETRRCFHDGLGVELQKIVEEISTLAAVHSEETLERVREEAQQLAISAQLAVGAYNLATEMNVGRDVVFGALKQYMILSETLSAFKSKLNA